MKKARFEIVYLMDRNFVIHTNKSINKYEKINKFGEKTIIDKVLPSTVK